MVPKELFKLTNPAEDQYSVVSRETKDPKFHVKPQHLDLMPPADATASPRKPNYEGRSASRRGPVRLARGTSGARDRVSVAPRSPTCAVRGRAGPMAARTTPAPPIAPRHRAPG